MSRTMRLASACALACGALAVGVHGVGAAVITDPTGNVSVATGSDTAQGRTAAVSTGSGCAETFSGVAVSGTGCADGAVAVSGTGEAFGGVAVSGTGEAVTDSDLTPIAVSGTGNAAGSGDIGAYTVSGTGNATGSNGADVSVAGSACGTGSLVEVSLLGNTCGAPVQVCGGCLLPLGDAGVEAQGIRRF